MQHSQSEPAISSEPVLQDSDYYIPCDGIGDTGLPKRILHGPMSKDTGFYSSRINQIIRQAEKYPGPGKYVAHSEWSTGWGIHAGNKFAHGSRDYKSKATGPDPRHYERADFGAGASKDPAKEPLILSNGSKDCLSQNRRILHGRIPKGKRRSFLDQAQKRGEEPGPGFYHPKDANSSCHFANRPNQKVIKVTEWAKEMSKSVSRGTKVSEIGPNHYNLNWTGVEEKPPNYTVPKEKAANFLDKAVKEKMTTRRPVMLPIPGPGHYDMQNFPQDKISRGTRHIQLRGFGQSPCSGYL